MGILERMRLSCAFFVLLASGCYLSHERAEPPVEDSGCRVTDETVYVRWDDLSLNLTPLTWLRFCDGDALVYRPETESCGRYTVDACDGAVRLETCRGLAPEGSSRVVDGPGACPEVAGLEELFAAPPSGTEPGMFTPFAPLDAPWHPEPSLRFSCEDIPVALPQCRP